MILNQLQLQTPRGSPGTALHEVDDSKNVRIPTHVNPQEFSIELRQAEHGNYLLSYPDRQVEVLISEKYTESS